MLGLRQPRADAVKEVPDELRDKVAQIDDWHEQGAPVGMGWGMYAGDKLQEVLEEVPRVRKDSGYPPLVTPSSRDRA